MPTTAFVRRGHRDFGGTFDAASFQGRSLGLLGGLLFFTGNGLEFYPHKRNDTQDKLFISSPYEKNGRHERESNRD